MLGTGLGVSQSASIILTEYSKTIPMSTSASGIGSRSLTVNWQPFASAVTYYLDFSTSPTFDTFILAEETVTAPTTSYTVIGLEPETTYYYRVRANTLIAETSTDVDKKSFTANWVEYTGAGSYLLDVSTSPTFDTFVLQDQIIDGSLTSYEVTGIEPLTTYYYRVRANSVFAKVATDLDKRTFIANWESYTGAQYYTLDVSTSSDFSTFVLQEKVVNAPSTSYTVTGLEGNTTYYYRVKAVTESAPFLFTINTTNLSEGSTTNTQFKLPLTTSDGLNIEVDWGDGSKETITNHLAPEVTHTYSTSGEYTIAIRGELLGWKFANSGDKLKILNIEGWSIFNVSTSEGFYGCENLTVSAIDAPLVTSTSLSRYFSNCPDFNRAIGNWDVLSVTDTSYMFSGASSFNQIIRAWDVSNVTNMSYMFQDTTFDQVLSDWDISNVANFDGFMLNSPGFNSASRYKNLLVAWGETLEALYPGGVGYPYTGTISIDFGNSSFTLDAYYERQLFIDDFGWTISDSGLPAAEPGYIHVGAFARARVQTPEYFDLVVNGIDKVSYTNVRNTTFSTNKLDSPPQSSNAFNNGTVRDIYQFKSGPYETSLICSGYFTNYLCSVFGVATNYSCSNIAILTKDGLFDPRFTTKVGGVGFNNLVYQVYVDEINEKIYAVGSFTSYRGTTCNRIVSLNYDGSIDSTFGTGFNDTVYSIDGDDNYIYLGGSFTQYKGAYSIAYAVINKSTGELSELLRTDLPYRGFNNGHIHYVKLDPNDPDYILCSGGDVAVNSYNGVAIKPRLARIHIPTDSVDTAFNAQLLEGGFNYRIPHIDVMPNGKILLAGRFENYGGTGKSYFVRLNSDGSLDTEFNAVNPPNYMWAAVYHPKTNKIGLYGAYRFYAGTAAERVAYIDADTGAVDTNFQIEYWAGFSEAYAGIEI